MRRSPLLSVNASRWLVILLFLALLELAVRTDVINQLFVAHPSLTLWQMLQDVVNGVFWLALLTTLYEVAIAFFVATVLGVAIGYFLWKLPRIGQAYDPLLAGLFSSPIILLYPIFLVIFGRNPSAVIALGTIMGILPVILYTRQAFSGVSKTLLKVGMSMNLRSQDIFRHILLPAAAPTIFTGLRLGLTYILIGVVSMEYIVQIGGLGQVVAATYLRFRMNELYSSIGFVIILSVLFIYLTYRGEQAVRK